jgi:predicted MFS family arabinose efflux permease
MAYGLQALGILLPVLSANLAAAYAGAVLFGGTFTSIVTIAMGIGRRLAPQHSALVLGLMTAAYGSGQMLGPWLAGLVAAETGSFRLPLLVAALVVTAGAATLLIGARYTALRYHIRYDEVSGI